ncbi:MAG: NUDIX domain-containing protein [Candidatus Liptonbacteria bacterium]|nr:NUDIX domain-containing protein [Candidatus Liptonbacteria bacterium]
MKVQKLFIATKAFIVRNPVNPAEAGHGASGKVLIVRESNKYEEGTNAAKFDVPGGRLTPGERFDGSLRREVKEETGLEVKIGKPFFVNEWRPVVKGEQWQVVGIFFECTLKSDFSEKSDFPKLTDAKVILSGDHDAFEWILPEEYAKYPLIENLKVAFEAYLARRQ